MPKQKQVITSWPFINWVIEAAQANQPLPNNWATCLSDRIETAIASSKRNDLYAAQQESIRLVDGLVKNSSADVRRAVYRHSPGSDLERAYEIGKAVGLSSMIAEAYGKRADDRFVPVLLKPSYRPVIEALYKGLIKHEFLAANNWSLLRLNRVLKLMSVLGIVDYTRDGNEVVYHLVPTAKRVFLSMQ